MKAEVVLTVAESKRLIAKGVAALPEIREKMEQGVIVLCTGTTNGYIYEELTGRTVDKRGYLTGRTTPAKGAPRWDVDKTPDLVLVDGQPAADLDRFSALEHMQAGDVYIKGANALNYAAGVAGITLGNPAGGTIGGAMGHIVGKKLRLLVPVGLEKEVPYDIVDAAALCAEPDEQLNHIHSLWPVHGHLFTEIEALDALCDVQAVPVAAGGIAGAEGGLRLLLLGEAEAVRTAMDLVKGLQGEPAIV